MKTLLIVAHPGHELRIFHWLELSRPIVSILTDGSGGDKTSRVRYSESTLSAAGASKGPVFGRLSDQQWYRSILATDPKPFTEAVDAIASSANDEACTIVSDAVDGYNPVHDLASAIGRAVALRLEADGIKTRRMLSPAIPGVGGEVALQLDLDEAATARKRTAARDYLPLAEEATRILAQDPVSLSREVLLEDTFDWPVDFQPHWEQVGRDRVQSGRYLTSITYRDHVRPIALALLGR